MYTADFLLIMFKEYVYFTGCSYHRCEAADKRLVYLNKRTEISTGKQNQGLFQNMQLAAKITFATSPPCPDLLHSPP